jgi:hypothetical protein
LALLSPSVPDDAQDCVAVRETRRCVVKNFGQHTFEDFLFSKMRHGTNNAQNPSYSTYGKVLLNPL